MIKNKKEDKKEIKVKKKKITDSKIKDFLDFKHIEELFITLTVLDETHIEKFLTHYKESGENKDKKMDLLIRNSTNSKNLLDSIKQEVISSIKKEHEDLNKEISNKRKKGEDMFLQEISSMSIPLKIKLFEATGSKRDFYLVKKIIDNLKKDLKIV